MIGRFAVLLLSMLPIYKLLEFYERREYPDKVEIIVITAFTVLAIVSYFLFQKLCKTRLDWFEKKDDEEKFLTKSNNNAI